MVLVNKRRQNKKIKIYVEKKIRSRKEKYIKDGYKSKVLRL